jgi:hypothetical protein
MVSDDIRTACMSVAAEGRKYPLWVTAGLFVVVVILVAYNSVNVVKSSDVLDKINEINTTSQVDRMQIKSKVGAIEAQLQTVEQKILPAAMIIELVNEQAAFPWKEDRADWTKWRSTVETNTAKILDAISDIKKACDTDTETGSPEGSP